MTEDKIFKTFFCTSVVCHLMAAFFPGFSLWTPPPKTQDVIEVDLVNWTPPPQAKPPKVDKKKTLPQLPKKFKVKDTVAKKKDPQDMSVKDKKSQKKIQAEKLKMEAIKKKALNELTQDDYIRRLQMEQARLAKEEGTRHAAWGKYQSQLKHWIRTHYTIPEVYKKNQNIKTTVELILDPQGRILKIKISQQSGDHTFDAIVLANLKKASPFPTPPTRLVGEPLRFEYSAKD